ncbi:MAG: hypothetical protein RL497_2743 [Pseudomonadota bacterium]|jgi:hypothetical protein
MVYQRVILSGITAGVVSSAGMGAFAMPAQDHINADVSLASLHSDNTLKTAANPISERQDTLSIGVQAQQTNRYSNLALSYSLDRTYFSEQSQEDENNVQGDAKLTLGQLYDWFNLTLQNSHRKVLNSSTSTTLLQNTGDRELTTVNPELRLRPSSVDYLILGASREMVKIKRANSTDANRDSANLAWQHNLSATDQMALTLAQGESTRKNSTAADYKYQSAHLSYQARLSHLTYSLQAGYQTTEAQGLADFSKPSYQLDLAYQKNGHILSLGLSAEITDTLFGDGNSDDLENTQTQDALTTTFDRINLTQASLSWQSPVLWQRILLGAQAQYAQYDYAVLQEDYTDRGLAVSLRYAISTRTHATIKLGNRNTAFEPGVPAENTAILATDYSENNIALTIGHDFTRDLSAELMLGTIKRTSDSTINHYDEQQMSVTARYQF